MPAEGAEDDSPNSKNQKTVTIIDNPISKKWKSRINELAKKENWLVVGVTRTDGYIEAKGRVEGLDRIVPRVVDFIIERSFELERKQEIAEEAAESEPDRPTSPAEDRIDRPAGKERRPRDGQ